MSIQKNIYIMLRKLQRAISWQIVVICLLLGLGCSFFSNWQYDTVQTYKPTLGTLEQIRDVLKDWKRIDTYEETNR